MEIQEKVTPEGLRARANLVGDGGNSGSTMRHLQLAADRIEALERGLRAMRDHSSENATQWANGAGSHHHPIWGEVAELLD